MPKYAKYDPTTTPALVTGWYDTDEFSYGQNLPSVQNLLELTEDEWQSRTNGQFQVVDNALCAYSYTPGLADVASMQTRILTQACQKQIVSGFASSALGTKHNYASTAIDQRNIVMASQSSKGGLLSCADQTGAWARAMHTQAQAQQALEDFVAMADTARTRLSALEAQITSATTVAAAQAVSWEKTSG